MKELAKELATRIADEWTGKEEWPEDVGILRNVLCHCFESCPDQAKKLIGTGIYEQENEIVKTYDEVEDGPVLEKCSRAYLDSRNSRDDDDYSFDDWHWEQCVKKFLHFINEMLGYEDATLIDIMIFDRDVDDANAINDENNPIIMSKIGFLNLCESMLCVWGSNFMPRITTEQGDKCVTLIVNGTYIQTFALLVKIAE